MKWVFSSTSWNQDCHKKYPQPDNTNLTAESKEELKSLMIKVKEESENAGLKLSIHKTEIMAYGPITSWQIREGNNGNSEGLF